MHSLAFKLLGFNSYWEPEAYIYKQISSRICNTLNKYWFSLLFSSFSIRRSPVRVETFCRPQTRRHLPRRRTTSQLALGTHWLRPKTCTVCLKTTKISWNVFHLYGLNVCSACLSCNGHLEISLCPMTPPCKINFWFADFYSSILLH